MENKVLKTSADDLYELVKSRKKISVEDAAKILKVPTKIVQALSDFLIEEHIFGIEYKFTTPFIYISQEKEKKIEADIKKENKFVSRDEFFQKAGKWNLPPERINSLWRKYIQENFNSIKEEFYKKASSRNISKETVDNLWNKYLAYLQ